jgi:general secretion pathway protein D
METFILSLQAGSSPRMRGTRLIKSLAPGVALSPVAGGGVLSMIRGDFEVLANAVISSDRVKILSTPEILLDDRSQGRVSVGQNVPFITGQFKTNETGGTDTFQTIERHDVGVSLSVSPVVLSPGVFKLQIQQDASSVSSSTVASDVITNTRNINTMVTVHAGEVIYLGGLYSEDSNGSDIAVPLLSKIPVLGWLFKSHKTEIIKRRLSVILSVETV